MKNKNLFAKYCLLILEYNKIHMLTGFNTESEIEDNLFISSWKSFAGINLKNKKVLDLGTGAGIPGIVLKIYEPSIQLTLLEVMKKRITFLKRITFINFNLIEGRAEESFQDYIEKFDIVTARALAKLKIALELAAQYLKVNGQAVFLKGPNVDAEIKEAHNIAQQLNLKFTKKTMFQYRGKTYTTVLYTKIASTPPSFPRRFPQIKAGY